MTFYNNRISCCFYYLCYIRKYYLCFGKNFRASRVKEQFIGHMAYNYSAFVKPYFYIAFKPFLQYPGLNPFPCSCKLYLGLRHHHRLCVCCAACIHDRNLAFYSKRVSKRHCQSPCFLLVNLRHGEKNNEKSEEQG
ncbi:MAG: hypothetical protein BWY84_00688 [Candidatus Aerophobetes bacterium ADurb.Bin490]|nr:MAG: hypothetical protein BWY84_00688 [Candidatus Aerophobetes bacterium ADurb.Bin490]